MLLSVIAIALLCTQLSTAFARRAQTTTIEQEEEATTSMHETTALNLGNIIDVTVSLGVDVTGSTTEGTSDSSEEATTLFRDATTTEE
ncbi:hypothetical protein Aduo_000282 [Ancylostoma duodenale]